MMRIFLKHIGIWIAFYVIYTFMMSYYDDYQKLLLSNIVNVTLFAAAYYLLRHVQIPYLYERRQYLLFGLSLAVSAFVLAAICRINGILWMDSLYGKDDAPPFITPGSFLLKTVRFYSPSMLLIALETYRDNMIQREELQRLEKEKLAAELKFLKAQLNPHFLFNTLNNLYSYVLSQSPKAPDMVLQLSNILDYILYKSNQKTVPLSEELRTIESFIHLEQIRYGDRLQVILEKSGNLMTPISPLLLLSVVENAFKHGASGDISFPQIKIHISAIDNTVSCHVWNTKSNHKGEINDAYKDGIGLKNIKRQLNLIYPDQHTIKISDQQAAYEVNVNIQTAAA